MPIATYLLLPWFASNGGTGGALGQNDGVWLFKTYLPATITVSQISAMAATSVTGDHYGIGLYDVDGNLVIDSGPIAMSTTGVDELLTAAITPVEVPQGTYWLAITTDSATCTIVAAQISASAAAVMCNGTSVVAFAANNSSGGQLPATTGTISLQAAPLDDQSAPFVKLQA